MSRLDSGGEGGVGWPTSRLLVFPLVVLDFDSLSKPENTFCRISIFSANFAHKMNEIRSIGPPLTIP